MNLTKNEARRYGIKELPVLVDENTKVSKSYNALGGMHANKPNHTFVLIDERGGILWSADYPSMWIENEVVLGMVKSLVQGTQ